MNPCIFSQNGQHPFRYDVCRSCTSYTEGCNNYLGEYRYSKPISQSRQIQNRIKMSSARDASAEIVGLQEETCHLDKTAESYSNSLEQLDTENQVGSDQPSPARKLAYNSPEKPFYFSSNRILTPLLSRPNFLERFRRSQR